MIASAWEIYPPNQIGNLCLGMSRKAVQEVLGQPVPDSMVPSDLAGRLAFHIIAPPALNLSSYLVKIDYSLNEEIEAIECRGSVLLLGLINVFEIPFKKLQDELQKICDDLDVDAKGVSSKSLGLSFFAPHGSLSLPVEAALIFSSDYYDRVVASDQQSLDDSIQSLNLGEYSFVGVRNSQC